jgi:hypothetical protein
MKHGGRESFGQSSCMVALLVACLLAGQGCGTQHGATDQAIAASQKRAPQGAELYAQMCAECHGQRGEGGPGAPPVMGPGSLPIKRVEKIDRVKEASKGKDVTTRSIEQKKKKGGAKELRKRFETAADIQKYMIGEHQRLQRDLADDDYWPLLTFLFSANGVPLPPGGLNAKNAFSVRNAPK